MRLYIAVKNQNYYKECKLWIYQGSYTLTRSHPPLQSMKGSSRHLQRSAMILPMIGHLVSILNSKKEKTPLIKGDAIFCTNFKICNMVNRKDAGVNI